MDNGMRGVLRLDVSDAVLENAFDETIAKLEEIIELNTGYNRALETTRNQWGASGIVDASYYEVPLTAPFRRFSPELLDKLREVEGVRVAAWFDTDTFYGNYQATYRYGVLAEAVAVHDQFFAYVMDVLQNAEKENRPFEKEPRNGQKQ